MQTITRQFIAMVLIASVTSPAWAARGAKLMEKMDTDGDGLISREEFQPPSSRKGPMFLRNADTNSDGVITLDEARQAKERKMQEHQKEMAQRQARMSGRLEEMFAMIDIDHDGGITRDEMRLFAFGKIDQNQDGYLSMDEFRHARQHRRMRHEQWQSGRQESDN